MAEEIAIETGRISNFQVLMSHDLDTDLGSGHTAYRRASFIDLYLHANLIETEETFCGRKYVRTDGRTFETGFIRSTLSKSRPKNGRLKMVSNP